MLGVTKWDISAAALSLGGATLPGCSLAGPAFAGRPFTGFDCTLRQSQRRLCTVGRAALVPVKRLPQFPAHPCVPS